MTQNLRIVNKQISSEDSNLTEGATYTIPVSSSPWISSVGVTAQLVHYAGIETNGVNYTWCATTADKGRYCTGATTTNNESENSICPRGWKLPTNSEYSNFLSKAGISDSSAGSTKIRGVPYNFPYAGYVSGGSLQYVGSYGYYWSSTASGSNNAYYLDFNSSSVGTFTSARYFGLSVRCIAP